MNPGCHDADAGCGRRAGAFIIAATAGFYGVHEHWTTWEVWTAAAAEVVAILAAPTALLQENPLRSSKQLEHSAPSH